MVKNHPPKGGKWWFLVLMGHRGWVYWAMAGGKMGENGGKLGGKWGKVGKNRAEVGDTWGLHEGFACSPWVPFHSLASFLPWTMCTIQRGALHSAEGCLRPTEGLGISWLALQFFPGLHIFSHFPPFFQYLSPISPHFPPFSTIFPISPFFLGNVVGNLIVSCVGNF